MLIRAIRAENFMRFDRLEISNIPRRGLIGIEGPNESGKSTIGEILLFVFFGKTRSSSDASLSSLIRWGTDSMTAEVEFTLSPASDSDRSCCALLAPQDFLIFRQIDKYGTNYVKVLELPERKEMASGCRQVADFVASRVKFDFGELQNSFFHDQHSGRRTPGSNTAFFEVAAGLKHLRAAVEQLRREREPKDRQFVYFQKEIARNLVQAEKLEKVALKIPDVSQKLTKVMDSLQDKSRRTSELKRRADLFRSDAGQMEYRAKRVEQLRDLPLESFQQEVEKLASQGPPASLRDSRSLEEDTLRSMLNASQSAGERLKALALDWGAFVTKVRLEADRICAILRPDNPQGIDARLGALRSSLRVEEGRRARKMALVALSLFTAAGLSALAALSHAGKIFAPEVWPEGWKLTFPLQLAGAAVLFFLAAGVAFFARGKSQGRIHGLRQLENTIKAEAEALQATQRGAAPWLAAVLLRDLPLSLAGTSASGLDPLAKDSQDFQARHSALLSTEGESALDRQLQAFAKNERDLRARFMGEAQKLEKVLQEEDAATKKLLLDKERTEGELRECQSQAGKRDLLLARNKELDEKSALAREEIDLQLLAGRLLEETIGSIGTRIGPALTRFTKSILPALTSGRYREVRVDNGLEVKVFSSEKSDFLALHELSGGTSEALSLALRLAVSHAFTSARTGQSQFVFLDEPFKMMDATRAMETLRLLPRLSPSLEQFFVAQPAFQPEARSLFDFMIHTSHDGARLEAHGDIGLAPGTTHEADSRLRAHGEGRDPVEYAART